MTKINMTMTGVDCIVALSEGNPGALNVLTQIMQEDAKIDPDGGTMGFFGAFLMLDTIGIYGSRLWMLYKDVCGQKIAKVLLLLRACQLGHYDSEFLDLVIGTDEKRGLDVTPDWAALAKSVKNDAPNFTVEAVS
jgi:hypothetical protein